MGHYDYMYENVTLKEVNANIDGAESRLKSLESDLHKLNSDLLKTSILSAPSQIAIGEGRTKIHRNISSCKKEIGGWKEVKALLEKGQQVTNDTAHFMVRHFTNY